MGLHEVPDAMPWGEAWRLTQVLADDPSSHVAAAVAGWTHPATREWLALADLVDVYVGAHARKGSTATYPRPWSKRERAIGAGTSMSVEQWKALRARLVAEESAAADLPEREQD